MSELVIHIGTHKTGSTAVQDTLFANRDELARNGVLYPVIGATHGHHALVEPWAPGLPARMRVPNVREEWKKQTELWRSLEGQVFLSSEEFSRIGTAGLKELRGMVSGFERVRILMVLRDQGGFLQSVYQEISDKRQPGPIPAWLDQMNVGRKVDGLSVDYDELFTRFATHFGAANIEVVSFADAREDSNGLVAHLLGRVDYKGSVIQSHRSNISEKPLVTFLANTLAQPGVAPRALVRQLDEFVTEVAGDRRTQLFSKSEVQRIIAIVGDSNEVLERRLGLKVGSLRLETKLPDETTVQRGDLPPSFWSRLAVFLYKRNGIGAAPVNKGAAAAPALGKAAAGKAAAGKAAGAPKSKGSTDPWFLSNVEGKPRPQFSHVKMPTLPDAATQRRYTGRSGYENLLQAFRFWQLMRSGMEPNDESAIMDFGCGWGRIGRFWLRDIKPEQLYLTDVMSDAVELVRASGSLANLAQCNPAPPLAWDVQFDLISAYSVFSHLNEELFVSWMTEFHRRLKPGGQVVFTSRGEKFIDAVRRWQIGGRRGNFNVAMMPRWQELEQRYAAGEFMFFTKSGGGGELDAEFYGQTFVPEQYVRSAAEKIGFKKIERLAEPIEIDQAVFRLTK